MTSQDKSRTNYKKNKPLIIQAVEKENLDKVKELLSNHEVTQKKNQLNRALKICIDKSKDGDCTALINLLQKHIYPFEYPKSEGRNRDYFCIFLCSGDSTSKTLWLKLFYFWPIIRTQGFCLSSRSSEWESGSGQDVPSCQFASSIHPCSETGCFNLHQETRGVQQLSTYPE